MLISEVKTHIEKARLFLGLDFEFKNRFNPQRPFFLECPPPIHILI